MFHLASISSISKPFKVGSQNKNELQDEKKKAFYIFAILFDRILLHIIMMQFRFMISDLPTGRGNRPVTKPGMRVGQMGRGKAGNGRMMTHLSQGSQEAHTQDGTPLTQGGLSQGMSQPGFGSLSQGGLSQPELSQDSYLIGEFQSQMDGLLSQDSTYQGDRGSAFLPGASSQGAQFTQVCFSPSHSPLLPLFYWGRGAMNLDGSAFISSLAELLFFHCTKLY